MQGSSLHAFSIKYLSRHTIITTLLYNIVFFTDPFIQQDIMLNKLNHADRMYVYYKENKKSIFHLFPRK